MTPSEFYTYQFYSWEYRGRGWFLAEAPVHLEPPYIPFFRHGAQHKQIDDGKRPTLMSRMIEGLKGRPPAIYHEQESLDYVTLEPYLYENDSNLHALQIKFSKDVRAGQEKMKAFLTMLSCTYSVVSFEIIGTATEIIFQFVTDETHIHIVETYAKAYFPQYSFVKSDVFRDGILQPNNCTMVSDFGLKEEFVRPLANSKNQTFDPLTSIIAILDAVGEGQQAGIQVLFQPVGNQWSESILRSVTMYDGTSFFKDVPEAPKLAEEKVRSALYGVTIRAFAQGDTEENAAKMIEQLSISLTLASRSPYNELVPLKTGAYDFTARADDIILRESHRLGMLLSQDELLSLVRLPTEYNSKKLLGSSRKTKQTPPISLGNDFILGENNHDGIETEVSISLEDRLKHMHILGATGTGKSTLISQLIAQDINHHHGIVLFDPHGDLVNDVIAHVPQQRVKDVVLIDPSDIEFPIGLNVLEARTDTEKEVLSSDLVAAFKKFATSWGDQMSGVLGNAILAILESSTGGSLHDLRRFLVEKEYRNSFLKTVTDPAVRYYWQKEYPLLKTNAIGPILIRLDTFLRPRSVRNMVVQKEGIDLEALLNQNKIVLLKLSQGLIGKENSFLLGSLILSKLHQIFMRRQDAQLRKPILVYLDEFHNFITPSIKEMVSGIRKYNVGLTLAHQDLQQLQREDGELMNGMIGNIYTRIAFRVGEQDAKKLQDGYSGFTHTDFQNLGRGEAIVRIEQPQYDCSLTTSPPSTVSESERQQKMQCVVTCARTLYATPKALVERMLYEDLDDAEIQRPPFEESQTPPPPVALSTEKPSIIRPSFQTRKDIPTSPPPSSENTESGHRYLQNLIKRVAESKGFVVTLEQQLAGGGSVDVLLQKNKKKIAVEICVTTTDSWEVHNIVKCLEAKFDQVISMSGDIKQLEKIKRKCLEQIPNFDSKSVLFFTPDAMLQYLEETAKPEQSASEQTIKGYRVNVTYDKLSEEEMERKRALVSKVITDSMKRQKGKK